MERVIHDEEGVSKIISLPPPIQPPQPPVSQVVQNVVQQQSKPVATLAQGAPSIKQVTYAGGKSTSIDAIELASKVTGVNRSILMGFALKESSFDSAAASTRSSAQGLFQFTESTWRDMVMKYGQSVVGHEFSYNDRNNAVASALAGAFYLRDNMDFMRRHSISKVGVNELYLAHLLGASGAIKLLRSMKLHLAASDLLPNAARSNPSIFYNVNGTARTPRQIYDYISNTVGSAVQQYAADDYPRDTSSRKSRKSAENTIISVPNEEAMNRNGQSPQISRTNRSQASIDPNTGIPILIAGDYLS